MKKLFSRKEYLDGVCSHSEYYGQLVNESVKDAVRTHWGIERLMAARDPHLNDLPLDGWDRIFNYNLTQDIKELGDYWTIAGRVSLLKTAARQIIEEENLRNNTGLAQ